MSGIEAAGIAASILQIADIGIRVSINLYYFHHRVKNAKQNIQTFSSDIALTCNVLNQLGNTLGQDDQARLCSPQALDTAQDVLNECKKASQKVDDAIHETKMDFNLSRIDRVVRKVAFVMKEPELDILQGKIERLKSTMLLMLNVIMYAGQVRSRSDKSDIDDQQGLIKDLMQEKRANDNRMKELKKALALSGITNAQVLPTATGFPVRNDVSTLNAPMEMKMYYQMIKQVIFAIDAFKFRLERGRYSRIRNGVQRLHEEENDKFDNHLVKLLRPYLPDLIPGKPKFEKHEPKRQFPWFSGKLPTEQSKSPDLGPETIKEDPLTAEFGSLVLEWTTLDKDEFEH